MFLWPNHKDFNSHQIMLNLWRPSDHAPLVVSIAIEKECYELTPRKENISYTFINLVENL